ncbi:zinc finger CCCH domain-containing protein 22 isoform X1 [Ziziphus jujuba]|uniref:Zinc finger CCCH domain-containing protein 22 isoform X1 n=1 Tax=Ziziphus jujuba TaxID=326968 RepID=A0ABM3IBZ5_ZIZJJ|nr:zinc finger CCCH domain-containing protein 22 isoform X1 [Ziziphus jujuba]
MDSYEATKIVFAKIQSCEPENASKIMGYLLIQDHGEKEMIRLAYGPETILQNLILKAKSQLGLLPTNSPSSLTLTTSTSSASLPFNPIPRQPNPLSLSTASLRISNNGYELTNPSSPSSSAWPLSPGFSNSTATTPSSVAPLLSYANVVNRSNVSVSSLSSTIEDYQLQDHNLPFLGETKHDGLFTTSRPLDLQKQSYSIPGMPYGSEDVNSGCGWKPCSYFARGFCKNGGSCRFLHGDYYSVGGDETSSIVGSPNGISLSEFERCQELLRFQIAAQQQQKLASASQFMAGTSLIPYNNCMDLALMQQQIEAQRLAAAALMKNDFSGMNLSGNLNNPGSRQIYLTFPADSTFREEDVSNYFSNYGPVKDVRIPYQQKRMFGFVTFVYPETVKLILAKGNPHFVCDSRVLVKPYKEKGKVPDKKQNNQYLDRGDYALCSSPTGLDCQAERMFCNTQEMLLAKKLEERANLQRAIELQGRKLMNLQLQDLKDHHHYCLHHHQYHHGLSSESSIPSPVFSNKAPNGSETFIFPPSVTQQEVKQEDPQAVTISSTAVLDAEQVQQGASLACNFNKGKSKVDEESDILESIENILPDSLFASPKKSAGEQSTAIFSTVSVEANESGTTGAIDSSNLIIASPKSAFSKCPGFLVGMEPLECN